MPRRLHQRVSLRVWVSVAVKHHMWNSIVVSFCQKVIPARTLLGSVRSLEVPSVLKPSFALLKVYRYNATPGPSRRTVKGRALHKLRTPPSLTTVLALSTSDRKPVSE
jgi:hypothetical protein